MFARERPLGPSLTIVGGLNLEPLLGQIIRQQLAQFDVVINHKDAVHPSILIVLGAADDD